MPRFLALLCLLAVTFLAEGCIVVDAPLMGLRTMAGGIHNRRRGVGIVPFFLPDGRFGCMANGALFLEEEPDGTLREILPRRFEVDDPCLSPDGRTLLVVAGGDQITAGGAHKDHVFQVYSLGLDQPIDEAWTRVTHSRRAEVLPRWLPDGESFVFVRRVDYEPYSMYEAPWGDGAVFLAAADGTNERQLTAPLFHPFRGLAVVDDGAGIVFGARHPDGGFALHHLELAAEATPTLLKRDALLPAVVGETDGLVYVRGRSFDAEQGSYATFDLCTGPRHGAGERVLFADREELIALAVSPDGARVLVCELVADEGQFGTFVLWEVPVAGGDPRRRDSVAYRKKSRFKIGDLIQPVTWWGRSSRYSPGSR